MEDFILSSGSVPGRDHLLIGKNNQDAFHVVTSDQVTVAVVCDGCGDPSSRFSEMGAILGAQMIAQTILRVVHDDSEYSRVHLYLFWELVRLSVLAHLEFMAKQLGESLSQVVSQNLLFTTVVVLITPKVSVFATIGDGVIIVNGERFPIEPYPNNEPPYLGYGLVKTTIDPELLNFKVWCSLPTEELQSFLIGSDGVVDLINSAQKSLPGKEDLVGPISQFWEQDKFLENPAAVQQRLTLINRGSQKINWEERRIEKNNGYLKDDTTIVVGRRKGE